MLDVPTRGNPEAVSRNRVWSNLIIIVTPWEVEYSYTNSGEEASCREPAILRA